MTARPLRLIPLFLAFVSGLAFADEPDRYSYRAYVTQTPAILDNFARYPELRAPGAPFADVELQIVSKVPTDVPALKAVAVRARADGVPFIPSFRLWPFPMAQLPQGELTTHVWIQHGAHLRAIVSALDLGPGSRFAFDQEKYYGETAQSSSTAFAVAAKPFLDAIRETGIVPCILDARPDYRSTQAIVDAAATHAEIWPERGSFNLPVQYFRDKATAQNVVVDLMRTTADAQRVYGPKVSAIRHVVDHSIFRSWGGPLRADLRVLGAWKPWVFISERIDEGKIGTPEWVSGQTLHTSNDVRHSWRADPLGLGTSAAYPGTVPLKIHVVPGSWPALRPDMRSQLGGLLTGGRALVAALVMPKAGDFSVAVEVVLPAIGGGPIVGACQANHESWQIVYDAEIDAIVLELRTAALAKIERFMFTDDPPKGVPIRLLLSLEGAQWVLGASQRITPTKPVGGQAGHLYVGAGTAVGTYQPRYFEGLVFRGMELPAARTLSAAERAAIIAKPYPR